ncbi:sugar kinase [Nocardia albiluteola]|uniref:sugar kinase n=1 Tax=Nocardia albiluteola TaxID=2842303 RepID=UPI0027E1A6B8|nr:sugar kinase [Nocardia albiluteola]
MSSGLVTLGETMVALSSARPGPLRGARSLDLSMAGAEATVAIGIARLGHPATWIGRLGDDELGESVRAALRGQGVRVLARADAQAPTGLMIKERRTVDVSRVHYYRAGSAGSRLSPDDIDAEVIAQHGILHITGITPALSDTAASAVRTAVRAARAADVMVSFDVNYRSRLWTEAAAREQLSAVARLADIVFASVDELGLVTDGPLADPVAAAATLLDEGPARIVLTDGARGAISVGVSARGSAGSLGSAVAIPGISVLRQPALPVRVADPVGAGDAFVAGYLSAVLDGLEETDRMHRAAAVAAICVGSEGDWEGLPTRAELTLAGLGGGTVAR